MEVIAKFGVLIGGGWMKVALVFRKIAMTLLFRRYWLFLLK